MRDNLKEIFLEKIFFLWYNEKMEQENTIGLENEKDLVQNEQEKTLEGLKDAYKVKADVEKLATVMDRYGLDAILGFTGGDVLIGAATGTYLWHKASKIGMSGKDKRKIAFSKIIDSLVGTVPVLGDIFDFFYRANVKSSELFEKKVLEMRQQALEKGVDLGTIAQLEKELKVVYKYTKEGKKVKKETRKKVGDVLNA